MESGPSSLGSLRPLVALLRRGLVSDGDAEEFFLGLRTAFDASGVVLGQNIQFDAWNVTDGVPDQWKKDHTRLREQDPSVRLLVPSPAGAWFVASQDMTAAEQRTEIMVCQRASGIRDAVVGKIYSPFRDDLFLALYREERPFDDDDRLKLDLLYPHIAGGLATRRAQAVLDGTARRRVPSIQVSFPDGRVTADAAARRAIERRVGQTGAATWARIERALAESARRFTLARAGGRSQVLWQGLRIDFAVVTPRPGEKLRLLGLLIDEDTVFADEFDVGAPEVPPLVTAVLSPRQLMVVREFAAGVNVRTIAEGRRLATETVRWHLRTAYRKLGIRSRAELTRALSPR